MGIRRVARSAVASESGVNEGSVGRVGNCEELRGCEAGGSEGDMDEGEWNGCWD